MDTIRDLLGDSARVSVADKALLVKLIWLHGQVDEDMQRAVSERVNIFFGHGETDWKNFMNEVRAVVAELEACTGAGEGPGN